MPHCDKSLYEETLKSYWNPQSLPCLVLLGNDLSLYSQRQKDTERKSLVTKFLTFSQQSPLPTPPEDLLNSFNELCVQYLPRTRSRRRSASHQLTPDKSTRHFFTTCKASKVNLTPLSNSPSSVVHVPTSRRIAWKKLPAISPIHRLRLYKQLSKARLTFLVTLTSMAGYALCPESEGGGGVQHEVSTLLSTASGVALCSASANAFNQMLEVPLDAQMARTRIRPLCTRLLSPLHAVVFGVVAGVAGVGVLSYGVNNTSATLGAANILLYSAVYTPLKRVHIVNTWVGSLVGAIPPLIGWTASCGGELGDLNNFKHTAALSALPYVLYTWQFPHFNSLAHLLRPQYAACGYKMLSVTNPLKNSIVSTRHALFMLPLTAILFPWSGLTTWGFSYTCTLLNAPFAWLSLMFYREIKANRPGDKAARRLFHASLIHLPLTLVLAMYHKRSSNHIDNYIGGASGTSRSI
ncbi:hypothetical protein E3P77_00617 [Wallemia ichthyophaga]|uniref:Protoheme IX farnesyltransferase, mitochondrial n=1 Tax=Wallemia ichthyophaga TaxID=245174 RepID=A0A4T0LHM1_WALIC|nr:hypothetical protein E3P90_00717 [Wallemia ichthyophaga]TIB17731.1 hypothetical protein E3P93_00574 [Wallemia ichthyophaga]TIB25220.1 hypothetical protein E3P89_00558 [Wallemia ichthyophaga]TIB26869.1 hypothetical protein E3P88_00586 [Wallemia ichthyophaga]TIB69111.1 hypothetical protein E3P77_00617 [Wallemia ichthyophaga]